jgi:hypothetical protein
LKGFYTSVIAMLGMVVVLAAPALTATSVTVERQRRSLELIFSAPVTPRYFLVGKLLSTLRYTAMLVILALPVLSVCVVLGGATWSDVLVTVSLLLMASVCFSSIGLLISTVCQSLVTSTLVTFVVSGLYLLLTTILSTAGGSAYMFGSRTPPVTELSWLPAINPFTATIGNTSSLFFGITVPSWMVALVWTLLFSRILILSAESILTQYGSKETRQLRIGGLIAAGVVGLLTAKIGQFALGMGTTNPKDILSLNFTLSMLFVSIAGLIVPLFACHCPRSDRKFRSNKLFSIKSVFAGNPDGALGYLFTLAFSFHLARSAVYALTPALSSSSLPSYVYTSGSYVSSPSGSTSAVPPPLFHLTASSETMPLVWTLAYFTFIWGICRFTSSSGWDLRWARGLAYALIFGSLLVPLPVLSVAGSGYGTPPLMPYSPFFSPFAEEYQQWAMFAAMLGIGLLLAYVGEHRYAKFKTVILEN